MRDPRDPAGAPHGRTPPPCFDFALLLDAQDSLSAAAAWFEKAYSAWRDRDDAAQDGARSGDGGASALRQVNQRLMRAERVLMLGDGLENRPWFRHSLYAPRFTPATA